MLSRYNPADWYWQADDGRIFSSARIAIVPADDAGLAAFKAAGNWPTAWPRDDSGLQTTAALQDVLGAYNLFADLKAYAADARYRKEVGGVSISGVAYPSDRETQAKLTAAALFSQVNPAETFKWKLSDGTFTGSLTATQMITVAAAVGAFVNTCFATEASVGAQIDAGTITTRAQVDTAFV